MFGRVFDILSPFPFSPVPLHPDPVPLGDPGPDGQEHHGGEHPQVERHRLRASPRPLPGQRPVVRRLPPAPGGLPPVLPQVQLPRRAGALLGLLRPHAHRLRRQRPLRPDAP